MSSAYAMNEPGIYDITTDSETVKTVDADSLDYNGPDGSLQVWKNGTVVATFRWWQSIVRQSD